MSVQLHNQLVVGLMRMVAFRLVFVLLITWLISSIPGWEQEQDGRSLYGWCTLFGKTPCKPRDLPYEHGKQRPGTCKIKLDQCENAFWDDGLMGTVTNRVPWSPVQLQIQWCRIVGTAQRGSNGAGRGTAQPTHSTSGSLVCFCFTKKSNSFVDEGHEFWAPLPTAVSTSELAGSDAWAAV